MKRLLTLGLTVLLLELGLSGCGCDDGGNVGLVFVNDSDATIVTVVADYSLLVQVLSMSSLKRPSA